MKTIIKIFICLSLIYTPFFAFAGAAEKWEVLQNNYDHQRNRVNIEARKITQNAANSGTYKVEIPVKPSTLGSTVKRMLWVGAAVGAVSALLEGVGWVIDVGSKTIKRPLPESPNNPEYVYQRYDGQIFATLHALACATSSCDSTAKLDGTTIRGYMPDGRYVGIWGNAIPNPNYDPSKTEYEYLSDSALGDEILGNGETAGDHSVIPDAYSPNNPVQDAPAPQETIDALDNANPEPETEPSGETKPKPNIDTDGDGEPDTYDPTQPEKGTEFKLPNFCSWAPAVCDFFTVQKADNKDIKKNQREQIEQDKNFFEKVAEWFDWSQADDELPDNESPEIDEHITPDLKEDAISWGAACPADVSIPISMQGVTSTLVFSWSPWCQLLSIIKPAIVASAYIGAAFIVLGLRT
ncbi:virulence factor TspB C-terminal domain-related protein [Acinetobacter sp. LH3_13]|uniref:virulence factor TspB C-terminal domain-related protein n=1 Tax=Acinetobacter sp. LH3_13 TaxID=3434463 RepID=UPI003EBE845E